ncbi:MAG: protein arginine kinase [Clostridia bacterium]|nr:protein arginine kinase [Clostridia bacterium]
MSKWYEKSGEPIAVSTRVRLARNLSNVPFPGAMSAAQLLESNKKIADTLCNGNSALSKELYCIQMDRLQDTEAFAMVERHIISPNFAKNRTNRMLVLSRDESISIMLGEEDHIRIQVLLPGFQLAEAYDIADKIDTILGEGLPIAFDEELGFLTECPTNLGTGLRASVMLHLPAIEQAGEIGRLAETVSKIGLTIRGTYGEGSNCAASLYQLSNQVTLGLTEQAAIQNLTTLVGQIMDKEQKARKSLNPAALEDYVYRAWGILTNARLLTGKEMMGLVSRVKLGMDCGILSSVQPQLPVQLLIETQPNMLMLSHKVSEPQERDAKRAEIFRTHLV